jgi:DNA-binding NarL/FixJ family response regulator
VRVVVADPRPTARVALHRLVEGGWSWSVVGEAADGLEAVRLVRQQDADVLLVDASVGGLTLRSMNELLSEPSGALVVGLLDSPHQHADTRGVAVLKGVPADRMRELILLELEGRGRMIRQGGT